MRLIASYYRKTTLVPLILAVSSLSVLALLTQSLSTIDLIVENRQSALTFLYITILALPQLLAVIMPIAVFIAALYALNKLNLDSEMVVAKAAGYGPWQLASPVIRVGVYALIFHLLIALFVQPLAQRQMRAAVLDVRTDLASQLVRPGEFNTPAPGLTVYTSAVLPSGSMSDILIYDSRNSEAAATYTAKQGVINTIAGKANLIMQNGNVQYADADGGVRIIGFDDYQFDLSEVMTLDSTLRLKASDQYLHELFRNAPNNYAQRQFKERYRAEGHMRLSSPLYNIALVMIAVAFLVRGEFQRMGYGRRIAMAAFIGFFIRLVGFSVASAAESDGALNLVQYAIPLITIAVCAFFLSRKRQSKGQFRHRVKAVSMDGGTA
ncbi:MAG: LptF/LptG family permease [Robiginitomaculum sp.]